MTDITELAQREKFEVWAHSQKLSLAYGDCGYAFSSTEMAWRAWMASSAELVEALEKAQQRITQLESRSTVSPVNYSENADADYCRKWAWEKVKDEVSTEDWTTGDSITYFGFFCWGWDMRRQYNEQRPITVKLPKTMYTEFDDDDYCREVAVLDRQQVIDCLTDAGIKVEAE